MPDWRRTEYAGEGYSVAIAPGDGNAQRIYNWVIHEMKEAE